MYPVVVRYAVLARSYCDRSRSITPERKSFGTTVDHVHSPAISSPLATLSPL